MATYTEQDVLNVIATIPDGRTRAALKQILLTMIPDMAQTLTGKTLADATLSDDIVGDTTGNVTGNLTGNVVGNVTGNVVGDVTGSASAGKTGTPVNAVAATGSLTIGGVVIDGETITIGSNIYEFDTDGSYSGGNVQVDISGAATASQGTLTFTGVAIDTETVTIGGTDIYEFDAHEVSTITGGRIRVDISEGAGYSTRSEGELTLANGDIHGDTIIVAGTTTTLKSDGTAGSASIIDLTVGETFPDTLQRGTATLTFAGVPADAETFTINARVYEFDTAGDGIGGDHEIDTSATATVDDVITKTVTDYMADGSRTCTAVADLANNLITFTAKTAGVVGNYVTAEAGGGIVWSGNLSGGADALGTEIGLLVLAHYEVGGAGEEATVKAVAGATDDKVIFRALIGGTAGDAITTTHTLTAGSFDAVVLGTKEAGADCTAADAVTALVAAITSGDTQGVGAVDGALDTVVMTADVPGVAGDLIGTTQATANATFDDVTLGTTTPGVDCPKGDAQTAIGTAINANETDWQIAAFGGDVGVMSAQTAGVALNDVATTELGANTSWGAGVTAGGIDGTVGTQWDILIDAGYLYVAVAANTIADANWERVAVATY